MGASPYVDFYCCKWAATTLSPSLTLSAERRQRSSAPRRRAVVRYDRSHGDFGVKGSVYRRMGVAPSAGWDPWSEPVWVTRRGSRQIKLTYGCRGLRQHQHPACGGRGSGGRDHSLSRLLRPSVISVRPPGSVRTDPALRDGELGRRFHHRALDDDAGGGVAP